MPTGILQAATVIHKTTQTQFGDEIAVEGYTFLTLFFTYTKGDETGLDIIPYASRVAATTLANSSQAREWDVVAGVYTATAIKYRVTATGNYSVTLDVSGIQFVKFSEGGSNNDGTPTGTLAASYTLSN